MNATGTPTRTDIRSRAWRLQSLFGPVYTIHIQWTNDYKVTVLRQGHRAYFDMVKEDFDYKDDELLEKFVNPTKACLEKLIKGE